VLILSFLILPRFASLGRAYDQMSVEQGWFWSYLVNVWIARDGWPAFSGLGHFWSLAIEEQFYLFWPLVVARCRPRTLAIVCLVCIISSIGIRIGLHRTGERVAAYVLTPARLDGLAIGGLLALLIRQPDHLIYLTQSARRVLGALAVFFAALFVWQHGLDSERFIVQTIGHTMLGAMFGALLVSVHPTTPANSMGKLFAHPAFVFFGHYSYGLYVFHSPLIFILRRHVVSVDDLPRVMGSQLPGQLVFTALAIGISTGIALLSWHLYEHSFLKLKRLFPYEPLRMTDTKLQ
jgi:peptidoglycan/LPS O-acetylase OafA/YrhL